MNTNVWLESGGNILRETLRQEARKWHLLHHPPATLRAWEKCRSEILHRLHANAGTFPEPVPLDVREYGAPSRPGYRITKLTCQSRPQFRVTANLYVPVAADGQPLSKAEHAAWESEALDLAGRLGVQPELTVTAEPLG